MTTTILPPVLNEKLVHRALLQFHNSPNAIKVKAVEYKLLSAGGENFCSEIYVANVCYHLNGNDLETSFVVKIILPEIVESGTNEEQMLTTVLPGMEACLDWSNSQQCGIKNSFHARCLTIDRNGQEIYVLENLNTLDYFCADRFKGLDKLHGSMVMEKIAKFHAASMLYAKKFPNVIDSLKKGHYVNGVSNVVQQSIVFGGLEYVADMIKSWPGYESLVVKVKNIIPRFNEMIIQIHDIDNAKFKVLNHGDLWVNNILFKSDKETNEPLDALFIDFQDSFWGGCGSDLNYFLNTSIQLDVLKEKRMDLLKSYHEMLSKTLAFHSYPEAEIPPWNDVLFEFKRSELIGLYSVLCELPIVNIDKSVSKDFTTNTFGNLEEMKKLREHMYANERVKESIRYSLKYYEEIGLLE